MHSKSPGPCGHVGSIPTSGIVTRKGYHKRDNLFFADRLTDATYFATNCNRKCDKLIKPATKSRAKNSPNPMAQKAIGSQNKKTSCRKKLTRVPIKIGRF